MRKLLDRFRELSPAGVGEALARNRQFVVGLIVVVAAVWFFPGKPAPQLLSGARPGAPTTLVPTAPPIQEGGSLAPLSKPGGPPPAAAFDDSIIGGLPPETEPEPAAVCSTDALADILDSVRDPIGALLGSPIPGAAIRDLAAIAAGCSTEDPTGPVLDLALEFAGLVPDTGLDTIDLPDLPGLPPVDVPDEVTDALGPLSDQIREGCGTLSLVAVVFAVLPAAAHLPVGGSDLTQFLGPVSVFCSLFDEDAS